MYFKINLFLLILILRLDYIYSYSFMQTASPELMEKYRNRFNETIGINAFTGYNSLYLDISNDKELEPLDTIKLIDDLRQFQRDYLEKQRKIQEEMDREREFEIDEIIRMHEEQQSSNIHNDYIMIWGLFGIAVIAIAGSCMKWCWSNLPQGSEIEEQHTQYAPNITFEPHPGTQTPSLPLYSPSLSLTLSQPNNVILADSIPIKQESPPPYDSVTEENSFVPTRNSKIPGPK